MNVEQMQAFRTRYREQISPTYRGFVHMAIVAITGLLIINYALQQLLFVKWWQLLVVPITLLLVNFAEYYAHRYLGHIKRPWAKLFYQRHTGDHHSFFLESKMAYESVQDWRVVLFPSYLIFAFLVGLILPLGALLGFWLSANTVYLFAAAAISGYLFYEVMHFSYHIPQGHMVERFFCKIPGWIYMRKTHILHHRRDLMGEKNFNITLPIFDYLLGTLYMEDDNGAAD